MSEDLSTRRDALRGLAAASLLPSSVSAAAAGPELCFLSAIEMARLIRAKKLSAREVLAAHLKQIERVNPKVNAIVSLAPEMAAEAAAQADERQAHGEKLGPLHGLPVAHKDLMETRGLRTTYGSPLFKDFVPTEDDIVVERMRRAGAVILGKTNTPEFGAGSQTFNKVFGATLNPYDLTKTCGGSSGGAAVALACGLVPVASGSDAGGSLRNPAAFCNVVGFRPSVGRVPAPKAAFAWSTFATSGCLGRTVADLAFAFSTIAGPDSRAPLSIEEPGERFAAPLGRSLKGVRVALFKDLGGVPFDPRVRSIVDGHRKTFESLGCIVEQAEPDFAPCEVAFRVLRAWNSAAGNADRLKQHPEAFKDTLRGEIEEGLRLTGQDLARAETAHGVMWRRFQAFLEKYEYFVLPTTQLPPFDVNTPYPTEIEGVRFTNYIDWMKACWYISVTGNPAASVPGGFTAEGLPVGVQIVGRHHQDFAVLQMAHAFEQSTGFGKKRPGVV
ncbi:amidase [Paludibaculum fermentans]|uniref:Amidase n=1 Tax=Paludibaculum fermentans TaxID=1473598 RepID=A0A7S7NVU0_PALFE|nr:amidase [Paludibaculum fermentans]QOY90738.1 amidase [Paludibaculum fermentans]